MPVDGAERQQSEQVAAIAEQKFEEYERYQAWVHEKLLVDEITDQAERLAAPMSHEFEYILGSEGLALDLEAPALDGSTTRPELVRDVLIKGLRVAEERTQYYPEWEFEVTRRRIELEEWDYIEALARGEGEGETLVVFSPHPDAVDQASNYIDGYNRERKKTMVRTITPSARGVYIRSTSLDQTNYVALQASIATLGYNLPAGMGSEEILEQRYWIHEQPPEGYGWSDVVRHAYDLSLAEQFGGEWYAGRRPIEIRDALAFVQDQPDLIEQHMQAMQSVMESVHDRVERSKALEMHRYNFAAALDSRLRGQEVENMIDAGDLARAEGKSFDRDCATLETREEQLILQGYGRKGEILCNCPFCFKQVRVDPCASRIICPECAAEVRDGKVIRPSERATQKALGKHALQAVGQYPSVRSQNKMPDTQTASHIRILPTGERVISREQVKVGGTTVQWINLASGKAVELTHLSAVPAA